jgi:hypothetical protein
MMSEASYSQGGSFQIGPGHKFLNHPDANVYNAYNMMDFSWWNYKQFNEQFYDVAKVKYLESFRLMGRIEATKTTLNASASDMRANVQYAVGNELQELLLQIKVVENQYLEYNGLLQELLVYQQECGRKIMDYTSRFHYNQSESIIRSLMLDSRSKYELGLADAGTISMRKARVNESLRKLIYGPPGQLIRNLLEMAGGAVAH